MNDEREELCIRHRTKPPCKPPCKPPEAASAAASAACIEHHLMWMEVNGVRLVWRVDASVPEPGHVHLKCYVDPLFAELVDASLADGRNLSGLERSVMDGLQKMLPVGVQITVEMVVEPMPVLCRIGLQNLER